MTTTIFVCGKCQTTASDTTGWQIVSGEELGEMIIRCPEHRGPGRPRFDPAAPTVRTTVRLTNAQVAKAEELGNGNVAQGVRCALDA